MSEWLIRFLRVSERPEPPPGSGDSLDTFRASRRYLYYTILSWFPRQAAALFGLLVSLVFVANLGEPTARKYGFGGLLKILERSGVPDAWSKFELLLMALEIGALLTFIGQLLFSGLLLKLTWELRWYMVGEEALRIREGLWSVREQTMTIANIQNMIVRQGPLQRLFGIADLEIHTAGGGSTKEEDEGHKDKSHIGLFRGLADPQALRDRINLLLNRQRGAGLGDVDDLPRTPPVAAAASSPQLLAAARAMLSEARALRREAERESRDGGNG